MTLLVFYKILKCPSLVFANKLCTSINPRKIPAYFHFPKHFMNESEHMARELVQTMLVYENFLSDEEEKFIFDEIDSYLQKLHYEFDHWDDAIHGYRETERLTWNEENTKILNRVRNLAFPPEVEQLKHVHVLDLNEKGYIKPHIDATRFCGDTIAGLSLLSDSVMRLVHDKQKELYADVLLKRRSLYVMRKAARFDYTHEILNNENSEFNGVKVLKSRRISVMCRNEPKCENN